MSTERLEALPTGLQRVVALVILALLVTVCVIVLFRTVIGPIAAKLRDNAELARLVETFETRLTLAEARYEIGTTRDLSDLQAHFLWERERLSPQTVQTELIQKWRSTDVQIAQVRVNPIDPTGGSQVAIRMNVRGTARQILDLLGEIDGTSPALYVNHLALTRSLDQRLKDPRPWAARIQLAAYLADNP